ncbi:MAG: hypothetical protein IKD81_05380 [Eubacteriaceae bacterium]|nr:hypothetical protein [Eubacteriaceae bacterium]
MEKKIIAVICIILAVLMVPLCPVLADDPQPDTTVVFANGKIQYDGAGDPKQVPDTFPGSPVRYTVCIRNDSREDTDWYMLNDVVTSFEEKNKAANGAYEYSLRFIDPSGAETVLYSSKNVGADPDWPDAGLYQTSDALRDYFFLYTLKPSEKAYVVLDMLMDGDTHTNKYMESEGDVKIVFQVVTVEKPDPIPDTGYKSKVIGYVTLVLAFLFLLGITMMIQNRKKAGGRS